MDEIKSSRAMPFFRSYFLWLLCIALLVFWLGAGEYFYAMHELNSLRNMTETRERDIEENYQSLSQKLSNLKKDFAQSKLHDADPKNFTQLMDWILDRKQFPLQFEQIAFSESEPSRTKKGACNIIVVEGMLFTPSCKKAQNSMQSFVERLAQSCPGTYRCDISFSFATRRKTAGKDMQSMIETPFSLRIALVKK